MHVLIVAATSLELKPLAELVDSRYTGALMSVAKLVTGVGLMNSTFALTRYVCRRKPNFIIAAGIGGSFDDQIHPGAAVRVEEDCIADIGAIEENGFSDVFDLNLGNPNAFPYQNKFIAAPNTGHLLHLPAVRACSVNEISSKPDRIQMIKTKYGPSVESMEGAAIHFVCRQYDIPFIHLRSISNYVGERNKSKWKMKEALHSLNHEVQQVLMALASKYFAP